MPEARILAELPVGSLIAPAGHGKTEAIAKTAALGIRTLILTHTHAGVNALRSRLKRLGIPAGAANVDTIDGWCMRYVRAFPKRGHPPAGMPTGAEWSALRQNALNVLKISAVRDVVRSSYDRILIDEYQDCDPGQHALAIALSEIVPTIVFGDPMQGIFEFANARLRWQRDVYPIFPLALELEEPRRWQKKNPALGSRRRASASCKASASIWTPARSRFGTPTKPSTWARSSKALGIAREHPLRSIAAGACVTTWPAQREACTSPSRRLLLGG
nr:UvrD-helicase domain-containing protein [Burkholderia cenocepacia]